MTRVKTSAIFAALMMASIGSAHSAGQLVIYNWPDYTSPELIEKFERTYDVKVRIMTYGSNYGALDYVRERIEDEEENLIDIVNPTGRFVPIWIEEGLLAETRVDQMENFKNVAARWKNPPWDANRHYSAPWLYGSVGPIVDTSLYAGDINTSAIWLDPPAELKGKINVVPEMNDVLYAAIRYMGGQWCNDDPQLLEAVRAKLLDAKKSWASMEYGLERFDGKDWAVSFYYNVEAFNVRKTNPSIRFGYPREGFQLFMDNIVVLKDAPNMENAKLFQNFIMAPENAALLSNYTGYGNAIEGSANFMRGDIKNAAELSIPDGLFAAGGWLKECKAEVEGEYPQVLEKYNEIWRDLIRQ